MEQPKIFVQIVDTKLQHLSGTSKKGNDYDMYMQTMYLHHGGVIPDKFEKILDSEKDDDGKVIEPQPYPVGEYDINMSESFDVFNGRITFNPVLIARKAASNSKAA